MDFKFTSRRFSSGAPFTLASTPAVAAYPGNSTVEITAGITLTVDFDARTGLNHVRIVATVGNGYAAATTYAIVITAGTVDGVSVVGEALAHFSLDNRMHRANVIQVAGTTQTARDLGAQLDAAVSTRLATAGYTAPLSAAQVKTEVVNAINVDTYAEPGQGTPPSTASFGEMLRQFYKSFRNKKDADGSFVRIYNAAGTVVDQKQATSVAGAVVTKDGIVSGP